MLGRDLTAVRVAAAIVLTDLAELSLPAYMSINFPEGREKLMHFEISIKPDEGLYK